jgi:hypothetical protein
MVPEKVTWQAILSIVPKAIVRELLGRLIIASTDKTINILEF